jgi:hypothetical protein
MRIGIAIPRGWRRIKVGAPIRSGDRMIFLTGFEIGERWLHVGTEDDGDTAGLDGEKVGPETVYDKSGKRRDGVAMVVIRRIAT